MTLQRTGYGEAMAERSIQVLSRAVRWATTVWDGSSSSPTPKKHAKAVPR